MGIKYTLVDLLHILSYDLFLYSYFLLALKESSKEKAPKNPTEEQSPQNYLQP